MDHRAERCERRQRYPEDVRGTVAHAESHLAERRCFSKVSTSARSALVVPIAFDKLRIPAKGKHPLAVGGGRVADIEAATRALAHRERKRCSAMHGRRLDA